MTYGIPRAVSIQRAIPVVGATVNCAVTDSPVCMILVNNPSGLIGLVTLNLDPGSFDGQLMRFSFMASITILAMTGTSFLGALTSAVSGSYAAFVWDASEASWRRCA